MNPIGEYALWFVLGVLAGWLTAWLAIRARRQSAPPDMRPELRASAPAPAPGVHPESVADHAHAPATALLIDVGAARAAGFNMKHADDLSIIDGIGPKIEDLLRANGIEGFVQLAAVSEADLLDVLERGGPSFRFTNPARWNEQAALAADNRWGELKELQRELLGATRL